MKWIGWHVSVVDWNWCCRIGWAIGDTPLDNPSIPSCLPQNLTNTGASGGPESEGELDQLMAALNFLRFLMLKDPRGVCAWAKFGGV